MQNFISDLINSKYDNISELTEHCVQEISKLLDINTVFERSSNIQNDKNLKGQDKIIDICKTIGTKTYINNINGQHLYEKTVFKNNNIELLFFENSCSSIPNLSSS